ncbi:MAG: hypothetical protein HFJ17_04580 [Clostridia bacterium]|nr:hypothetical protein [Clostridia bacterium]
MNILSAFIVFDVLIIIYELLIEMFSALYELSGLTKEQARFQVTSILTGTGFTTTESEKMLSTKKRKRVTRDIMIISYIFNISIISTLITIFTSTRNSTWYDLLIGLAFSILVLFLVFFSRRVYKIRKIIDRTILSIVGAIFYKKQNQIVIYEYYNKDVLAEVKINKLLDDFNGKTLSEINLDDKYNIRILSIKRKNKVITKITSGTKLYKKDLVLMIGNKKIIDKVFGG